MHLDSTIFSQDMRVSTTDTGERPSWLPVANAQLLAFLATRRRFPLIGPAISASLRPIELMAGAAADGVVGWGDGPLARMARLYARIHRLPFWTVSGGFLQSPGASTAPPVSIVTDDLGIHFSAHQPSRLETLLQAGPRHKDIGRASDLRQRIVRERLCQDNHLPEGAVLLRRNHRRRLLLIDQAIGDRSIESAGADAGAFARMWAAARADRNADIIIKCHADVVAGRAKGFLQPYIHTGGVQFVDKAVSLHSILDLVDEVWTVSSHLGLEALLREIPVVTFGMPFYAGWGLTDDRAEGAAAIAARARRTRHVNIDEFADAAFLQYSRYVDPVSRHPITAEQAVERLLEWRHHARSLSGRYLCVNFSLHKRSVMRRYLSSPRSEVRFATDPTAMQIQNADTIVLWGNADPPEESLLWKGGKRLPIIRVEDGFIRSSGLGSSLVPPSSLCFDRQGIYFNASAPSQLETILNGTNFDEALLDRAKRLRQAIVSMGITKYNLPPQAAPDYRAKAKGRTIVLVAGQVPNDASLRFGMPSHASDVDLLKAARRARPNAFIIYKQHPDLLARNEGRHPPSSPSMNAADLVIGNVGFDDLLQAVDEVHVATSLIGFEALLREKPVWCHGLPFYAGWGLTHDTVVSLRRKRLLSLDALVAGALILYPRYWSNITDLPCEAEDVVAELYRARLGAAPNPSKRRWLAQVIHMLEARKS
ncbi:MULTISPECIES: capsular polysaccharide biosynthesis protein [unclassified Rhizobium]|uniref:capsular polysaccharide biosynthesis protein n=1 Tax=unclassified Rhizobium TaxID=2613769 RepID=UPI00146C2FFF|nr:MULTISPECIES: capsular polysaccharide biosynthesis protein [unclassified Rhizobium]MDK4721535.1 capsular polysaccharide biosynthesis protein [Rhizobium sp. CNPSo 3968]